jgi:CheY-like chemotaxis protein
MSEYHKRKTILCIDDDASVLAYHRTLLEKQGYEVLIAVSPQHGLQIATVCGLNAVIVDYHMPEMNGHKIATEIKRLSPQVPIIMVSGDSEIREQAMPVADVFISKDDTSNHLLPLVSRICG